MAMVATDIKDMLSIQIKSRPDSYSDQYNRLFMLKLILVSSLIMGLSWFTDSINCIVPDTHGIDGAFISAACWIQGIYIYTDLWNRTDETAFFGITKDIDMDGILPNGELCNTEPALHKDFKEGCSSMEKTFFLQYHWMPFFIAALIIPYYIPYIFHRTINSDLISLKNEVKKNEDADIDRIIKHFFHSFRHPTIKSCGIVLGNVFIKLLYIAVNVGVFIALDFLLNQQFRYYGHDWVNWAKLDNTMQYDYMGHRDYPKPGNLMLPAFGYCQVYNQAKDIRETHVNKHKFVCEISQHILYQYVLLVLWVAILSGIVISVLGLVFMILYYLFAICIRARFRSPRGVRKHLCLRELEYLDFIHKRNELMYNDVLEELRKY